MAGGFFIVGNGVEQGVVIDSIPKVEVQRAELFNHLKSRSCVIANSQELGSIFDDIFFLKDFFDLFIAQAAQKEMSKFPKAPL